MTRPEMSSGSAAVYPDAGATSAAGQGDVGQRGVGELVKEVTQDLTRLVNQELALAKAELTIEAKKAGKTGAAFGGAGLAGYFTVLFASLTLLFALASWWDSFTWAALAVTVLWGIAGAVLFARAKKQAAELNPKPERTIQTLKEGVR
jgi:hypothetical protein